MSESAAQLLPPAAGPSRLPAWKELLIGLAAVLLPACVLASGGSKAPLPGEYNRNAWFVAYYGEHFREHACFPEAISTGAHAGLAVPVFYGFVLFKIVGLFSAMLGCHVAIRLVAVATLAAVYVSVRRAARRLGASPALAVAAACCSTWATYSLTNLYNRFALAEFVAGGMLTCACCCWMVQLLRPRAGAGWPEALAAGLFFCLAAGTHPTTGMFSIPVFAAIYLLHWLMPAASRPGALRRHLALAVSGALAVLVLAPWLYAYLTVGTQLGVRVESGLEYFGLSAAQWTAARLFPLPADPHGLTPRWRQHGLPYLDTQINVPLLLLGLAVGAGLVRRLSLRRCLRLVAVLLPPLAVGIAAFWLSVYPHSDDYVSKKLLGVIQFSYRLVGLVNVALVVGFLTLVAFGRASAGRGTSGALLRLGPASLACVMTLAGCGVALKVLHGRAGVSPHGLPVSRTHPAYRPWLTSDRFGVEAAYATFSGLGRLTPEEARRLPEVTFPVESGRQFGKVLPVTVEQARDGYVRTSAIPFRWGRFRVDGRPVPDKQQRMWIDEAHSLPWSAATRVAVPVPAGRHVLEYEFAPPRPWKVLNAVSSWALLGLAASPLALRLLRRRVGASGAIDATTALESRAA